jgi:hypothetical protein
MSCGDDNIEGSSFLPAAQVASADKSEGLVASKDHMITATIIHVNRMATLLEMNTGETLWKEEGNSPREKRRAVFPWPQYSCTLQMATERLSIWNK